VGGWKRLQKSGLIPYLDRWAAGAVPLRWRKACLKHKQRFTLGYLGLVPSEFSTGRTTRRGGITRAGNARVRHKLIEGAWTYRLQARPGERKLYILREQPPEIQDIAWKAQPRLTARYRKLVQRGKKSTVVTTAIAREMAAFMWDIARRTIPAR